MKVPKSFMVLGVKYKFKLIPHLMEIEGKEGFCDIVNKVIAVDPSLKGESFFKTLCHELGHARLFEMSMHLALPSEIIELVVDNIGNQIVESLKVNF